eukprot:5851396-Prorocentrum_lima.AAC.1
MTSSLVGSEMCIRDRCFSGVLVHEWIWFPSCDMKGGLSPRKSREQTSLRQPCPPHPPTPLDDGG